jgi:anthranilate phosphoribosyltransferase
MDALKKALLGEVLEEEEAYGLMQALMRGEVSPVKAAGLLTAMALRGRGPTRSPPWPGPCGRRRGLCL